MEVSVAQLAGGWATGWAAGDIGLGLSSATLQTAVVKAVEPQGERVASGIFFTSRYLGSVVGSRTLANLLSPTHNAGGFEAVFLMVFAAALLSAVVSYGLLRPDLVPAPRSGTPATEETMELKLKNKIALVTGGSRGIGRATALCFAEEGCNLGICARGQEGLDRALGEIRARGVEVSGTTTDVSENGEAERFVNETVEELGGIDILINNVGGSSGGVFEESSDDDWQKTFDLNLFHSVRATQAALPHFRKRGGGSVVIISSISGWKPTPLGAQYGCAKAAEMFLAGALAMELAPDNIRVNTVCPGSTIFPEGGWAQRQQS